MITLTAPAPYLQSLRDQLWHDSLESAAILLCVPMRLPSIDGWRLILTEMHVAPDSAYEERTATSARLTPDFGLPIERKARERGWSIVYVHTHPGQHIHASFSPIDDAAERALAVYAEGRSPGVPHAAMVFSNDTLAARRLGTTLPIRVVEVGTAINVMHHSNSTLENEDRFDRQIRAFGREGQNRLRKTRVAIVGLGGTGTVVAQQLAHLGVEDFLLVDRDDLEVTNLNRTVGATPQAVSETKVAVAERMIRAISPAVRVNTLKSDVLTEGVGRQVAESDCIFCCTDSHASRHLLNQLSYQFLVPLIDMGVSIDSRKDVQFAGHVKALAPGLPCLWCIENLSPRQVREEMMSAEHRQADPYFANGGGDPQPAVISINSTVASLAVTMFLSMVTGVPAPARYVIYDGNRSRVSSVAAQSNPACNFCSASSTALTGDASPLPERRRV